MRKLASIRTVESVHSIPEADRIEKIVIDGWQVVTQKGNFKEGDLCVYFEIDSCFEKDSLVGKSLPEDKAGNVHTEEKGTVVGHRIKTIKLRGQVSQGYALPLAFFPEDLTNIEDLTSYLNVLKYEKPESYSGPGAGYASAAGSFPTDFIKKTDQERAENCKYAIFDHYLKGTLFEVSYKLDGSSITVGSYTHNELEKDVICSRNLQLKLDGETDTSHFLIAGRPVLAKLKEHNCMDIAVQGELVSPGIQKNFEGVTEPQVYIYSVWDVKGYKYFSPVTAKYYVENTLGLKYVPVMHEQISLVDLFGADIDNANDLLTLLKEYADGPSGLNGKYREGLVYKSKDGSFSFKTISSKYLLKEK